MVSSGHLDQPGPSEAGGLIGTQVTSSDACQQLWLWAGQSEQSNAAKHTRIREAPGRFRLRPDGGAAPSERLLSTHVEFRWLQSLERGQRAAQTSLWTRQSGEKNNSGRWRGSPRLLPS